MHLKIQNLINEVNSEFVGRGREVEIAVASLVAREHCCFFGAPGTAKSAVVNACAKRIADCTYFWEQCYSNTSPSSIFGQVSLVALQTRDVNERNMTGHLPTAHIGFLDEAFNLTSNVLVGLHSMMQERTINNGNAKVAVPLITLFGASNAFPTEEQLGALVDRFLSKLRVEPLSDPYQVRQMITMPEPDPNPKPVLSLEDLNAAAKAAAAVTVSDDIVDLFMEILAKLFARKDGAIIVSDRRKKKCWKIVKAKAFIDGRTSVMPSDLAMLRYCLWTKPSEIAPVEELLADLQPVAVDDAQALVDATRSVVENFLAANIKVGTNNNAMGVVLAKCNEAIAAIGAWKARCVGDQQATNALSKMEAELGDMQRGVFGKIGAAPGVLASRK
jgi:MoxR-like ATPase